MSRMRLLRRRWARGIAICVICLGTMPGAASAAFRYADDPDPAAAPNDCRCAYSLVGTDSYDKLVGNRLGDAIDGGAGSDRVFGRRGRDCLSGGAGDDAVHAGPGADLVHGGAGRDAIDVVGGGADRVDCGPGDDTARVSPNDEVVRCEWVVVGD